MKTQSQDTASPFHAGERAVQSRLGVAGIEHWARQVIRPYLPEQHRAFHTAQPFLVAAARDAEGRPWATVLSGPEGFVTSPDPRGLTIDARPPAGDALEAALTPGADIGLLGIELATRRRNRVNGRIADGPANGSNLLVFKVGQSFGNCPQYITPRRWRRVEDHQPGDARATASLSSAQADWITGADTFFIASGHRGDGEAESFGMDASHRGGEPGFVTVISATRVVFPDYAGNNHYNTIGNLVVDPRIGLLFVDFSSGNLLQLSGRARIDWASDAVGRVPGAHRLITMDIEAVVELPGALSLRWETEAAPARSLRVVEKRRESADVTSFLFEARDGGDLPRFEAGQHLPIELPDPETGAVIRRTYSLSGPATAPRYRISVKREPGGLASTYLHDRINVGDVINAGRPAGDFVLPKGDGPVVLISAGVGITPMVSMLHALAQAEPSRDTIFLHGAADLEHLALADEVTRLAGAADHVRVHTAFSRPGAVPSGSNFHVGRIDGALLDHLDIDPRAEVMICGPVDFMAAIQAALISRGIAPERLHTESFGPTG